MAATTRIGLPHWPHWHWTVALERFDAEYFGVVRPEIVIERRTVISWRPESMPPHLDSPGAT
jgi:hypothetical protein